MLKANQMRVGDIEVRDQAWYRAKAKEINDLRRENLWSVMDVVAKIVQRVVVESKPKPRFKDGGKIITSGEELVLTRNESVIKKPVPYIPALRRMHCKG